MSNKTIPWFDDHQGRGLHLPGSSWNAPGDTPRGKVQVEEGVGASPEDGVLKEKPSPELKKGREQVSLLPAPNSVESFSSRFQERPRRSVGRPSKAQNKGEGEAEGEPRTKAFPQCQVGRRAKSIETTRKQPNLLPALPQSRLGSPQHSPPLCLLATATSPPPPRAKKH